MQDLIDFPCSDEWARYYQLRGLTPYAPAEVIIIEQTSTASIKESDGATADRNEVARLRMANQKLQQELNHLYTLFNKQAESTHQKDTSPPSAWERDGA